MELFEEEFFIAELKKKIEEKAGFTINEFQDCKSLSETLKQLKIAVSAHTLARFFGLMKDDHRPYTSTLNLLANFLDFDSFHHFKKEVLNSNNFSLKNQMGSFTAGDFSFVALELAIQQCDWKNVQLIIDSYQFDERKNDLSMYLGNAVRQHHQKDEFLKALVDIDNGIHLYYESFVDEDDPGNYYSKALTNYYVQTKKNEESQIFTNCFINSKKAYSNQAFDKKEIQSLIETNFDFRKLHYHQVSRILEMRILALGKNHKEKNQSEKIIQEVIELLPLYSLNDQCWILARVIKALSFTKKINAALKIQEFNHAICSTYFKMEGKIKSIAELIIQLTYHALLRTKDDRFITPNRIQVKHLNETNARILIEAATAQLYAKDTVKSILDDNIRSFAKKTGHSWVFELLK